MNLKEFAGRLTGRHKGEEVTDDERHQADELGYVVVFGYSDDMVEFNGAIDDEFDCYIGGEIYIDENGIFEECEYECKYSNAAKTKCKKIEAVWDGSGGEYAWTYETDIPHETFDILDEEGNKWCRGMVFEIKDLE